MLKNLISIRQGIKNERRETTKTTYWLQVTVIVTISHPSAKQKQFISPDTALATNPSFEHFVGSIVSKVVVECWKKFCLTTKVNTK